MRKNIFTDSPAWIWPSKNAVTSLGLRYAYYIPHFATLSHLHAISHVLLALEQRYPDDTWKPERQIKAERPRYAADTVPPYMPDGEWQSATLQVFPEPSAMVMLFPGWFLTCLLGAGMSGAKCTKLMSMG